MSKVQIPLSIVIIAKNEEKYIPLLLKSIRQQSALVNEIIVADAESSDKTKEIALQFGCHVVPGGPPAVGRNSGGVAASSEYMLFLDADMILPTNHTLLTMYSRFLASGADIASVRFVSHQRSKKRSFEEKFGDIVYSGWNVLRQVQKVTGKIVSQGGGCILVKREVFTQIKGFDTTLAVAEDTDFFKRAVGRGYRYTHFPDIALYTSARRFSQPKNLPRYFVSTLAVGALIVLGLYTRKKLVERFSKGYGKLGGDGKNDN